MAELTGADGHRRPVVVLPVTCCRDGREHLVAEDAIVPANAGRYTAACGHRMLAAVLACPAGPPCRDCLATRSADQPRRRRTCPTERQGVWARLTTRLNWARRRRHPRAAKSESAPFPNIALPLPEPRADQATDATGSTAALVPPEPVHRSTPQ